MENYGAVGHDGFVKMKSIIVGDISFPGNSNQFCKYWPVENGTIYGDGDVTYSWNVGGVSNW